MKKLLIFLTLAALGHISYGQQLPLFSQYIYNKFLINPAVAGSDGYTSINLAAREQWVGVSRAPQLYSLNVQTRFLKHKHIIKVTNNKTVFIPPNDARVGLGGSIFSYTSGLIQRSGFQAAYSYHLWLHGMTQLSFGLAFTGYYFRINVNALQLEDPNEPLITDNLRKGVFVPDAAFGIYVLNRKYNFGFSADQLFGASAKIGNPSYSNLNISRTFYCFGSYGYDLTKVIEIRPSILVKMSEQLKPQADLGVNVVYNESFWAGLTMRTGYALIGNIGVRHNHMHIGYAFDFTMQQIQRISYGTHELNVAWKFGDSARRYRWLDRY